MSRKAKTWAYGVTTVPERRTELLPRTLDSLAAAGFDKPRLFVDGAGGDYTSFGLEVTTRDHVIKPFGNWALALWELYIRQPLCTKYAIFQDDMVTYRDLRQYLDSCVYPTKGYWNLYTFPVNEVLAPVDGQLGWYLSNQLGKGAVALVFDLHTVTTLLSSVHFVGHPQCGQRAFYAVDGVVVTSLRAEGWKEYVHKPSLVQHTGAVSSMRGRKHPLSLSFRGEQFSAMNLELGT